MLKTYQNKGIFTRSSIKKLLFKEVVKKISFPVSWKVGVGLLDIMPNIL